LIPSRPRTWRMYVTERLPASRDQLIVNRFHRWRSSSQSRVSRQTQDHIPIKLIHPESSC
jgi:hypothetical protein